MAPRQSVLVISSDSFRWDNLSVHGGAHALTPNLDAFARTSCVFESAYAGSYPTIPNRNDIFTGRWTFPNKDWSPLDADAPVLAQVVAEAGAHTHLETDCPHMVNLGSFFERGFQSWNWVRGQENDAYAPNALVERMEPPGVLGKYRLPILAMKRHMANAIYRKRESDEDYSMATVARNAMRVLEHSSHAGPFFMWVDMFDPHEPFDPPQHYMDLYYPSYKGVVYQIPVYGPCGCYTKAELAAIRAAYLAEATMVDHWVGSILRCVEQTGLGQTTTVIFTSDHGLAYGDHGQTGKNLSPMYGNIARIPLLISTPAMREAGRGRKVKQIVQPVDLMPTVLDLMGIQPPKAWQPDGVSLAPLLAGRTVKTRDAAFTGSHGSESSHPLRPAGHLRVSTSRWALIVPPNAMGERGGPMLFDLAADPGETTNVIKRHRAVAKRLYGKYVKFFGAYNRAGEEPAVPALDALAG